MLISGRAATSRLESAGISRRQSTRVLASGLAGRPVVLAGAHGYDEAQVSALADRPALTEADLDRICPHGLFVARREVDVAAPRERSLAALSVGWDLSVWTVIWLRHRIELHGSVPFVATVGSFVAFGADLVGAGGDWRDRELELRDPGRWFEELAERRVLTGPGRPWVIRGWQPFTHHSRRMGVG